jgi:CBS domain-containing protein
MPSAGVELRVAAAGPATSLGLGAAFLLLAIGAAASGLFSSLLVSALGWLAFVNVVLAVFNLIPAAPLDGGRILAGALWSLHGDRNRAEITATQAGKVVGLGLIGLGIASLVTDLPFVSIWTALLGWFIVTAATAEQRHARMSRTLGDRRVRDVMTPNPETTRGWQTVEAFVDESRTVPARQSVYPVEEWEGGISGIVTLHAIQSVPLEQRRATRVTDVSVPLSAVTIATPDEQLIDVANRPAAAKLPYVVVFDGGRLVGVVSPTDLAKDTTAPPPPGAPAPDVSPHP